MTTFFYDIDLELETRDLALRHDTSVQLGSNSVLLAGVFPAEVLNDNGFL